MTSDMKSTFPDHIPPKVQTSRYKQLPSSTHANSCFGQKVSWHLDERSMSQLRSVGFLLSFGGHDNLDLVPQVLQLSFVYLFLKKAVAIHNELRYGGHFPRLQSLQATTTQLLALDRKRNAILMTAQRPMLRSSSLSSFLNVQIGLSKVVTTPLLRYRLSCINTGCSSSVSSSSSSSSLLRTTLVVVTVYKTNNILRLYSHARRLFYKHFDYTLAFAPQPLFSHTCCPPTSTLSTRSPSFYNHSVR